MADFELTVPGRFHEKRRIVGERFERGSAFEFSVYAPPECTDGGGNALYLLLEHNPANMIPILRRMMTEDFIPYGMVLFCWPGVLPATMEGGSQRGMRAEEFDQYGPEFTNLLVEELVPEACRIAGVTLSESPDMHFITGGSSGGMAAWNAVWFRNDYFRRAFLSSPTFSAMRGGEEPMVLVRKTEPRPIKLYITCGTEEPDYFFGSSLYAAQNAASALEFAGYDFRFEQFTGEGHCCRREDETLWRRMMNFVWSGWRDVPVRPLFPQIRVRNLVVPDDGWSKCSHEFTAKDSVATDNGTYSFSCGCIYQESNGQRQLAADGFGEISAIALSRDNWRLYVADAQRRFVYAMTIQQDGTLDGFYKLAPLHIAHDARRLGATDIAVLDDDRVLAATELGVQGIVSFGLTDLILPLPNDLPAERLDVVGDTLYVSSGEQVFRRRLKVGARNGAEPSAPATPGYSDGVSYSRSHLIP